MRFIITLTYTPFPFLITLFSIWIFCSVKINTWAS